MTYTELKEQIQAHALSAKCVCVDNTICEALSTLTTATGMDNQRRYTRNTNPPIIFAVKYIEFNRIDDEFILRMPLFTPLEILISDLSVVSINSTNLIPYNAKQYSMQPPVKWVKTIHNEYSLMYSSANSWWGTTMQKVLPVIIKNY